MVSGASEAPDSGRKGPNPHILTLDLQSMRQIICTKVRHIMCTPTPQKMRKVFKPGEIESNLTFRYGHPAQLTKSFLGLHVLPELRQNCLTDEVQDCS